MSHFTSRYKRSDAYAEDDLSRSVIFSGLLHLLAAWLILFGLPALLAQRDRPAEPVEREIWSVKVVGGSASTEPVLVPNQEGAKTEGASKISGPPPPPLSVSTKTPELAVNERVIPLGPINDKAEKKDREIVRKKTPVPVVNVPPVLDFQIQDRIDKIAQSVASNQQVRNQPSSPANDGSGLKADLSPPPPGVANDQPVLEGDAFINSEMAFYLGQLKNIIEGNWRDRAPYEVSGGLKEALYYITIETDGRISKIVRKLSTGSIDFDTSFERAITLSNPLPQLPPIFNDQAATIGLKFNPYDIGRRP